jgi:hypothetical protein
MKMYEINKKTLRQILTGLGIICLFLSACATLPKPLAATQASTPLVYPSATSTSLAPTSVQEIHVQKDYFTASSFQELARLSPLIVIRQVTEISDVINAFHLNNQDKPSTPNYYIGQI